MAISLIEALKIIERQPLRHKKEIVCLEEATGRVCAQEIQARYDLPGFDNSAMDGYAVKTEDAGKEVVVVDTVLAGESPTRPLEPGSAIRIMTGAMLPSGCEAVVPFEEAQETKRGVLLPSSIKKGGNLRFRGEDVERGSTIVEPGELLDAHLIALLASQGISYLEIFQKPRVVVFATGDELKMHYEPLQPGSIYNSNTPSLAARAKELGCAVTVLRIGADDPESIKRAIRESLGADLIVTSGGVSVGDADHTKTSFIQMGMEIFFDKVKIKPGKPTTFGRIGETFVLNLPGNPLAAQLNFELFGKFLIARMRGLTAFYHRPILARLAEPLFNKPGRDTMVPGFFDGEFFHPAAKRAPGMVSTMAKSNGYIVIDKEAEKVEKEVRFLPLWEFYAKEPLPIVTR